MRVSSWVDAAELHAEHQEKIEKRRRESQHAQRAREAAELAACDFEGLSRPKIGGGAGVASTAADE
eukprot:COSAG01_NODE_41993_length_444_cov_9.339130_2_plen_65_part_01